MLINIRRAGWIEDDLFGLFEAIREEIPECHALSFSLAKLNSGKVDLSIYYHEGKECIIFDKIEELLDVYKQHQILFQKFRKIRYALNQ